MLRRSFGLCCAPAELLAVLAAGLVLVACGSSNGGSSGNGADLAVCQQRGGGSESCDGQDNDCDGAVDELVTDFCTDCRQGGQASCRVWEDVPSGAAQWDVGAANAANVAGLSVDGGGALTLNVTRLDACAVWIANTGEGTVSKLDCTTGEELARYNSVGRRGPDGPGYDLGAAPPPERACNDHDTSRNRGNCPSRTAVSQLGHAYVANRAFDQRGSVTKIAGNPELCTAATGRTSVSVGGRAEVVADDDCVLWTSAPDEFVNGVPRGLAVGLAKLDGVEGDVFVGLFAKQAACLLDSATGELVDLSPSDASTRCLNLDLDGPDGYRRFEPYGAAADSRGRVWFTDLSGADDVILAYVDTRQSPPVVVEADPLPASLSECRQPYGIVVDGDDRVYQAQNGCGDDKVLRYDARKAPGERWEAISLGGATTPRGVAISADGFLYASIASDAENAMVRVNIDDPSQLFVESIDERCDQSWGCGLATDESMWAVCKAANKACRRDPVAGTWACHPVGERPYSYSDIAGGNLNLLVQDTGFYRHTVAGCSATTRWNGIGFRADVPPATRVVVEARSADTREAFANGRAGEFLGPFEVVQRGQQYQADLQQAPGPVPDGQYLQWRLRLESSDRASAPRVFERPEVVGTCLGRLQ